MLDQHIEDIILRGSQFQQFSFERDRVGLAVCHEKRHLFLRCFCTVSTAQYRLDARHKLSGIIGFWHIVIGAALHPDHLIGDIVPCRGDNDRDIGDLPDFRDHFEPIHPGKRKIKYDQVKIMLCQQ